MKPRFAVAALCLSIAPAFSQDSLEKYRKDLETNPRSSLTHYWIGEILAGQQRLQEAANEFREALTGDLQPKGIESAAHSSLANIFERTGQHDRASNEHRLAGRLNDAQPVVVDPPPIQTKEPEYSEEGRIAGLEGTVILSGTIADDRSALDLRVTQSLGLGLDEKAI